MRSTTNNWNLALGIFALILSSTLFIYGIHLPLPFRVRGDAAEYLLIANQFGSLHDALHYIGNRTPGFPLFDYLFIHHSTGESWETIINHLCWALFVIHEITIFIFCGICAKLHLFKQQTSLPTPYVIPGETKDLQTQHRASEPSIYYGVLFFLLSTYPALVMHTSLPLTDTFGMDLLLLVFSLFAYHEWRRPKNIRSILLGFLSGAILGYAVLVRPSYWVAAMVFLLVYALISVVNHRLEPNASFKPRLLLVTSASVLFCTLIFPVLLSCKTHFGSWCLENPATFPVLRHVKDGLVGARVLWNLYPAPLSTIPVVPDPFMVEFFYFRCPLTALLGIHEQSLVGCLVQHPTLSFIFLIKKWIGFFDAFRMTPYTELITPVWYLWVSRIAASLAFIGLFAALFQGIQSGWHVLQRKPSNILFTAAWFFCVTLLSMHTLLHVEERFIFPCIPLCLAALLRQVRTGSMSSPSWHPCYRRLTGLLTLILLALFFIQVLDWDSRVTIKGNQFQLQVPAS